MEKILLYITNHYIYFVIAAGVLIISAVGYVVEDKKQKVNSVKDVPLDDEALKQKMEKEEGKK